MKVLDLFAGPGGWSEGIASVGGCAVGLELDADACRTRVAAGHLTVRTDVAVYPPGPFAGFGGMVASPPCQAFSMAGNRRGVEDLARIHSAIKRCRDGWVEVRGGPWADERSPLILEPLRWAWTVRPTWIACEQVPPCLPVWEHMADVLRSWGYDARALKLLAADYGVPQTRLRAFLLAHRDGVRVAEPTHAEKPEPGLFGDRLPWVTMAEALGWEAGSRAMDPRQSERAMARVVPDTEPSRTVCGEKLAHGVDVWRLRANDTTRATERRPDEPAPTLAADQLRKTVFLRASNRENGTVRDAHSPAPTLVYGHQLNDVRWVHERPATTIAGSFAAGRVAPPGHHDTSTYEDGSERITLAEAAILQGFRPDYPFQGSRTSQFRQVGNAVPPTWAAQLVRSLAGRSLETPR